jgi:hypothetical protein
MIGKGYIGEDYELRVKALMGVRPRILAMLTTGVDERRSTKSRQRPSTSGRSAALDTSRWAMKKSGFADYHLTSVALQGGVGHHGDAGRIANLEGACPLCSTTTATNTRT